MVQRLANFSVEELQRTFKRAVRPGLILTAIVVMVRILNQFNIMVPSSCTLHPDFANVLLTVRILPYVLPVVNSLFDGASFRLTSAIIPRQR